MQIILKKYNRKIIEKARGIKALIFDVDGVLTDGGIIYSSNGEELKKFSVKDGQIIKPLKKSGIIVGAITSRSSKVVERRCKELELDFYYQGVRQKNGKYKKLKSEYKLSDSEIAYVGDDISDIQILKQCGLAVVPADAVDYLKPLADIVTKSAGGEGVVREVADLILSAKDQLKSFIANI